MLAEGCEETCEEAHVVKQKERGERRKERPKKRKWAHNDPITLSVKPPIEFKREGEREGEWKIQEAKERRKIIKSDIIRRERDPPLYGVPRYIVYFTSKILVV